MKGRVAIDRLAALDSLHHSSQFCHLACSLIGVSVVQSVASAVLAPSLRHVADMLALSWRAGLTRSAFAKYLVGEWMGRAVLGNLGPVCMQLNELVLPQQHSLPPSCRQHLLHHLPAGRHDRRGPATDAGHWCALLLLPPPRNGFST